MKRMELKLAPLVAALCITCTALATSLAYAQTKVVFVGDSLTEGYGVAKDAAYPSIIEAGLKARGVEDVIIVNAGVSGSTTASGTSRLKWHLNGKPKPSILVLALGANDGLRGLDVKAARKNLAGTMDLAKANGMRILLAGMQMPPNYGKEYAASFKAMFEDLAKEYDATLIPFLLEGVAADPTLNIADGIHPNEKGQKILAQTVLKYLEPFLPAALPVAVPKSEAKP